MRRLVLFIVLTFIIAGCGVDATDPVSTPLFTNTAVSLQSVTLKPSVDINAMEEGVGIFIRVTSLSNSSSGVQLKYPAQENTVLSMKGGDVHYLIPSVPIQVSEDIHIEIGIVAIPTSYYHEAINIIGYFFTEAVETIVPGGKIVRHVPKYILERLTDNAKIAVQEGRIIGYTSVNADMLAGKTVIETEQFSVSISIAGSVGEVVTPPIKTSTGCDTSKRNLYEPLLYSKPSNRMHGDRVQFLQQRLLDLGYKLPQYGADGWFGPETELAVKAFQQKNGLEVDGVAGPFTWACIKAPQAVPNTE